MNKLNLSRFVVFFLFIVPTGLSGQKSIQLIQSSKQDSVKQDLLMHDLRSEIGSIEEYVQLNQEHPSEKIFLHLDRPDYMQGDTIWFKAYLWYGYDQLPDTISEVLYVDLVSAKGRVMQKKRLLIKNGTSHGDFCLDTTISPGSYSLRAYTRLMHNPNAGEPYYQIVTINPANQNFQFECVPVIIKQTEDDSLKVGLRFFEIDQTGNLNNSYNHEISYSLNIGDHLLQTGNILVSNTKEHVLKFSLAGINTHDSLADLGITIQDNRLTFEKQFHIPLQDNIDLQFFPEGGNLVNGLESKVAFKAIGADGLGKEVTGEIKTDDGKIVTGLKSTHKGMGIFLLKPESKKEYLAHLWYNNQKYIVPLPRVSEEGSVMSVSFTGNGNDPFLSIKQKPSGATTKKYIIGSAYGKIWFSAQVKTFRDSCRLRIPLELLPEGVCRLTVLNANFKPECERLIYVDKNQQFKIEVIPDSSYYEQRSKVTLLIKATDTGGTPVLTELSLAVLDKKQITKDVFVHGISAYKLLDSELRGYIEDVGFYFKNGSCTNKSALDILLLTQGYRKFLPASSNMDKLKFQPEKHLDISGKIKLNGRKSREKKFNYREIDLLLIHVFENSYLGQSNPDNLGKFRFQIPLMYGKSHFILQATTPKKKPFNGDIFLDNPVALPQFTTLPPARYNIASTTVEYVSRMQSVKKTEISKNLLPGSIIWDLDLGEVVITAKANAKYWHRNYEKYAIKIAELDSLDPMGNRYRNIYDLLVREFGASWHTVTKGNWKTVLLPCIKPIKAGGRNISYWCPIYVIDGKTYWNGKGFDFTPLETLSVFPVNEIKRILVIPPMQSIVMHYSSTDITEFPQYIYQSMVVIETYSKNTYRGDPQGIKTFILNGLDAPRVYYSPRYEGSLRKCPVYDGRATLFWEPSIWTDVNGQAKVEFYTSDCQSGLEVIVNGIEVENGHSGEGHAQINLNFKRLEE